MNMVVWSETRLTSSVLVTELQSDLKLRVKIYTSLAKLNVSFLKVKIYTVRPKIKINVLGFSVG